MPSSPLNLPEQLQQKAERIALTRGISLEEFILQAVAEKIEAIASPNDDLAYPNITYRRGVSGELVPVLRGTRIRVQTIVIAAQKWQLSRDRIANEALAFYTLHHQAIDSAIATERMIEEANV